MNPQPPKLYSLIKLHKDNYPIRSVVSYVTAPAVNISKYLVDIIKTHTKFKSKYSIKNSYELVNNIKDLKLPSNTKLISFDVKNLFPSVPPNETIMLIKNMLEYNRTNPVIKDEILQLLSVCVEQNYFSFNKKFYKCKDGLIMGNPLSPLLAEIFMDHLENLIFDNKNLTKNLLFWYRYVDDILVGYIGTDRQLNNLFDFINSLHHNITFTLEKEVNGSINFLDLTLKRVNNSIQFSIYHKESHTDTTIHNKSNHPYSQKLAAYHSMIHRLINIPMLVDDYNKEYNIIKQLAVNNGYDPNLIDKLISKKMFNKTILDIYPVTKDTTAKKFKSFTYLGHEQDKLMKFLRYNNINIAYKTNNSLAKYIKNNKEKTIRDNKSGVYMLNCGSCNKKYIGQTGRTFKKRIANHFYSYTHQKNDSAYASHLIENDHCFNKNFDILHVQNKSKKLDLLESLEINRLKYSDNLLNDKIELNHSPLLNLYVLRN